MFDPGHIGAHLSYFAMQSPQMAEKDNETNDQTCGLPIIRQSLEPSMSFTGGAIGLDVTCRDATGEACSPKRHLEPVLRCLPSIPTGSCRQSAS